MTTKKRSRSHKKRTTTRKKATAKKVTTRKKTKATKKMATTTKRASPSKAKRRKGLPSVKVLMPRQEGAAGLQEARPVEVVEVARIDVMVFPEPSTRP